MLILTAPAKTLDFETEYESESHQPLFLKQADQICSFLKTQSSSQLQSELHVSEKLAELNKERYQHWEFKHSTSNARPALFAYKGDIFKQLQPYSYTKDQRTYLHEHLRIASGVYGYLRGLDLMQPYRLEMKLKLSNSSIGSLQRYWKPILTESLLEECRQYKTPFILNLASKEYSDAFDFTKLPCPKVDVVFLQERRGERKTFGLLAKIARGMMIHHCIKTMATSLDQVLSFNSGGYTLIDKKDTEITFLLPETNS